MTVQLGPSVSANLTDPILADLVEELAKKLQAGEIVDPDALAAEHPDRAEQILQLLPAVQLLAEFGISSGQDRGPLAALVNQTDTNNGTLGDYRLIREVGRGGMGVVYEAEQISLCRRVALKVLPFAAALDAKQLQRFKNEAQAAAHLHHTNIVPVYGIGCERAVHFYAMQFIEGQTLAHVIADLRLQNADFRNGQNTASEGSAPRTDAPTGSYHPEPALQSALYNPQFANAPTPPVAALSTEHSIKSPTFLRTVANLGAQAAGALEYAHQMGVIHRDIKPANLLLDARGNLWITDFGLAHVQSQAGLTMTGDLVGTLRYMSPEQALANRVLVDQRTDIYSLGATLYELLTLQPAFGGRDRQELLRQIAFEEPKPPRRLNKAIPQELETVVLKAMGKDPGDRYATAQELADDLGRFLKDEPIWARQPTLVQRTRKWIRRHAGVTVTAGVALVLVLVVTSLGLAVNNLMVRREEQRTKAANDRLQGNLSLYIKTLDEIYLQVLEDRMGRDPAAAQENQELLTKALGFYEQFAERNEADPEVQREVASAYDRAGVLHTRLGHEDKGLAALSRAEEVATRLSATYRDDSELKGFLAGVHLHKAKLSYELSADGPRESETAREECRKGIDILGPLIETGALGPKHRETLATLHNQLALLSNDPAEQEIQYYKAIELQSKFADQVVDLPSKLFYMQQLSAWHVNLGNLLDFGRRLDDAEDELRQAVTLLTLVNTQAATLPGYQRGRLPGFPSGRPIHHDLAIAHWTLGGILRSKGQYLAAENEFKQAVDFSVLAVKDWPREPLFRRRLANIRRSLGIALFEEGKRAEAREQYRQSIDLRLELAKEYHDMPDDQDELSDILNCMGNLLLAEGDNAKAAEHYRQARDLWEKLVARFPNAPEYANHLAWFLVSCEDPQFSNPAQAVPLAQKAVDLAPKNGWFQGTLGLAQYRYGQYKAAVATLEKANQLRQGGFEGYWMFQAMAHWRLGEKEKARTCYDRGAQLMKGREFQGHVASQARSEAEALLGIGEQKH